MCCHCWASGTLGWVCGGPWHRHEVRDLRRSWFSHFLPFEYRHTIPPGRVSDALWITEETLASLMRQTHISSFSYSIINPDGQLSARPAGGHPCLSFGWDGSTGWLSEVALGHMVLRTPAYRPSGKPLVRPESPGRRRGWWERALLTGDCETQESLEQGSVDLRQLAVKRKKLAKANGHRWRSCAMPTHPG